MINTALYARENYKGTGTPDLFITPHMLNQMLLARDINGRRIYSSKAELATALNVGSINTAEQFEGKTRTTSDNKRRSWLLSSQIWQITPRCNQGWRGYSFHSVRYRLQPGKVSA